MKIGKEIHYDSLKKYDVEKLKLIILTSFNDVDFDVKDYSLLNLKKIRRYIKEKNVKEEKATILIRQTIGKIARNGTIYKYNFILEKQKIYGHLCKHQISFSFSKNKVCKSKIMLFLADVKGNLFEEN